MTRIVCVGITVLDRIWYLDDLPKEGGKYVAKDYTEVGGGPAATAAVAAAKSSSPVRQKPSRSAKLRIRHASSSRCCNR